VATSGITSQMRLFPASSTATAVATVDMPGTSMVVMSSMPAGSGLGSMSSLLGGSSMAGVQTPTISVPTSAAGSSTTTQATPTPTPSTGGSDGGREFNAGGVVGVVVAVVAVLGM
jgi:hypothetical protein